MHKCGQRQISTNYLISDAYRKWSISAFLDQTTLLKEQNRVQKLQEKSQRFYISTERFSQPTAITCYVQSEGYGKFPRLSDKEHSLIAMLRFFIQVGLDISRTLLIDGYTTSEAQSTDVQMTAQSRNDVSSTYRFSLMITGKSWLKLISWFIRNLPQRISLVLMCPSLTISALIRIHGLIFLLATHLPYQERMILRLWQPLLMIATSMRLAKSLISPPLLLQKGRKKHNLLDAQEEKSNKSKYKWCLNCITASVDYIQL